MGKRTHDQIADSRETYFQKPINRPKSDDRTVRTNDPRVRQAKVLWDKGWGRELGMTSFGAYLASIPAIPERPTGCPAHLNRLVLWDVRPLLPKGKEKQPPSLVKACHLLSLQFPGNDTTLVQHAATPVITTPVRWLWCQDGRMHRNRTPSDCRRHFVRPEVGAEALTGLFLFAQDPRVIGGSDDHVMDLPGSVHRGLPSRCACLGVWGGRPRLSWAWFGGARPLYGSASRWE
jgi:hypothetical protein